MKFPEIRVTRSGRIVERVLWDPCKDGAAVFDLTGMKITQVKRVIGGVNDSPAVEVTFVGRLVEVEESWADQHD